MQWVAWDEVPDSSESTEYGHALCDALVELVRYLTR
jgi:hypothetical protein